MTASLNIKFFVRCLSVLLALGGVVSGFLMLNAFAYDIQVMDLLDRIIFLAFLITIPTLLMMNLILVLREWSKGSIRSFSLVFALVVCGIATVQSQALLNFGQLTNDRFSAVLVASALLAGFFASYFLTKRFLDRHLSHETNK